MTCSRSMKLKPSKWKLVNNREQVESLDDGDHDMRFVINGAKGFEKDNGLS